MFIIQLQAKLPDLQGCQASCSFAKQLTCAVQMATHEGRIKELQEELTTAYKEKGKLAEDLLQAGAAFHACCDSVRLPALAATRQLPFQSGPCSLLSAWSSHQRHTSESLHPCLLHVIRQQLKPGSASKLTGTLCCFPAGHQPAAGGARDQ